MSDKNSRARELPASPGVAGALKDALGAIAQAVAPKSVTQRKAKINEGAGDYERYSSNQTTDKHN